ncbi:MAG: hypothetical protein GY711_30765 [bacterium]|nr:hypothetical protein [bacterium]
MMINALALRSCRLLAMGSFGLLSVPPLAFAQGVLVDTFFVESSSPSGAAGATSLQSGATYRVVVDGTFSYWDAMTWQIGTPCGNPEATPIHPSAPTDGLVGTDPEWTFAANSQDPLCGGTLPSPGPNVEFDLGVGQGWTTIPTTTPLYAPGHEYEYSIVGEGAPLRIHVADGVYADNYGQLRVRVFVPGDVIDNPCLLDPGATLVDFELFPIGATSNPLTVSDVTFSAGPGLGIVSVEPFGANGSEVEGKALIPFASGSFPSGGYSTMTLTFIPPVRQVGLGWWDPNWANNMLVVRDAAGTVLATASPPQFPPSGCCAAFLGAAFGADIIASVEVVPHSGGDWYAIDNVAYFRGQPTSPLGASYCAAAANSTGVAGTLLVSGSDVVAQNDLRLCAYDLPEDQFGYFLASRAQATPPIAPPGSQGLLCLAGNIGRFNAPLQVVRGPADSIQVDLTAVPVNPVQAAQPGDTWNFQCWYRDVGNTNNFTDAVSVLLQ